MTRSLKVSVACVAGGLALTLTGLALAQQPAGATPGHTHTTTTVDDALNGAAALDGAIDWSNARLIAVQDGGRFKTLESFARESMDAMTGEETFNEKLSPIAAMFEWMFNRNAYADERLIRIKARGLQYHFSAHMPADEREAVRSSGRMTLRELFDPRVIQIMKELEPRFDTRNAMSRVRHAEIIAKMLERMLQIVPPPNATEASRWLAPQELTANLPQSLREQSNDPTIANAEPIPGLSAEQAVAVLGPWARLQQAWLARDAGEVQKAVDRLAEVLPTVVPNEVYPARSQLQAEAKYYAFGKFVWGYWIYFLAMLIGIWAMVTRWRVPYIFALGLLLAAIALHTYGLSLRWYILGRIPVANMFEAVTASALVGVALAFVLELAFRVRVFLVAASATGFLALVLGYTVLPGTLTTMMGILDDIMLRIHTVLIIASYALIFLAAVIAVVYLFGYYVVTAPAKSTSIGALTALVGGVLIILSQQLFTEPAGQVAVSGLVKAPYVALAFGGASVAALAALIALIVAKAPGDAIASAAVLLVAAATVAVGEQGFIHGVGLTAAFGGLLWALGTGGAMLKQWLENRPPQTDGRMALAGVGAGGAAAFSAHDPMQQTAIAPAMMAQRPILAGGAPGDDSRLSKLPLWLNNLDWCHLIILNMVFVMLFVGIILGAVWADYSWGRPWGWDPKEVFAMNTWIVYAILLHARFVVKRRGLWTAWLSAVGCLMMAFNWAFVNFYIVGLHSYA